MSDFVSVATIIGVAMITPGPNNFIVMAAASRNGPMAMVPAMAGIISGGLVLLFVIWIGAGSVFSTVPGLQAAIMFAGVLYLIWLGGTLMWAATRHSNSPTRSGTGGDMRGLPCSFFGVFAFQFFNPKAWILVMTVTASMTASAAPISASSISLGPIPLGSIPSLGFLMFLFLCIPLFCLSLWGLGGLALRRWLDHDNVRRVFDFIMGALLAGSAAFLMI